MGDVAGHWREALEALPVGVALKGRDGRYLRANAAFARLAGRASPAAVEGLGDADLPWAAEQADAADDRAVLSLGGSRLGAQRAFRGPDGRTCRVSLGKVPLRDEQGETAFVLVTVQELPEAAPVQPRDAYERVGVILDSLPYPFYAKDAGLTYTDCNRAFERFVGKPRAQILGRTVFDVYPAEMAEGYHRADQQLLEQRGTQIFEAKVRNADGVLRDVIFYKGATVDAHGRATGIVGVYVDVTDRKKTELALQESEHRYRQLAEGALVGTFVVQGGKLVLCNERFAQIFGHAQAGDLVGREARLLAAPEDAERVERALWAAGVELGALVGFRGLRRDGGLVELEAVGSEISFRGEPAVQGTLLEAAGPRRAGAERERLEAPTAAAAPFSPERPAEAKPAGGETILLVEDNEMVRRTTAKILELSGYRVIAAASGEAGLVASQAEPGPIDLLLTDVVMPGMNGRALFQKLRAARPGVRALFMSGHDRNVVAQKGILEDGASFLQKPFMPEVLARKIREALEPR